MDIKNRCFSVIVLLTILVSPAIHANSASKTDLQSSTKASATLSATIQKVKQIDPVYVQRWGLDTDDCGTKDRPCLTINMGISRAIFTIAPYSPDSVTNIYVGPGVYQENLRITKSGLRITSTHGTDSTIIEARSIASNTVHIAADGIYFGSQNYGFTLTGSDKNGLFSSGNYVTVTGNRSINNGERGFQFGASAVTGFASNPAKGTVSYNIADNNGLGGFYFYDFDDSEVRYNEAHNNQRPPGGGFPGVGSGFWIDTNSNNDIFEYNIATRNESSGFFYRRLGVVDQITRYNQASENDAHGFMLMGDALTITHNVATANKLDGFHYMGYDQVLDFSYNTSVDNIGTGVTFGPEVAAGMTSVDDMHHNNFINNDPGSNCGMENNFQANAIHPYNNFWGNMFVPGPGANPADELCGFFTVVSMPTSSMN